MGTHRACGVRAEPTVRAEEIAQAVDAGLRSPSLHVPLATALSRTGAAGDMAPLAFLPPDTLAGCRS
ncbi:hypothetical protein ABT187_03320 [Streptomyces sp. NPDC001817]|uniref:hypothetical protein n=1 Tax=Streptomyces sp. NPDC001817 TaxID=3154398 RepID=UPI00332E64D6